MSNILYPPFVPSFGNGAPSAGVPKSGPYYDTATNPYTPYIYTAGAWHTYGAAGVGGGNANQIQGIAISATPPANGQVLSYNLANNDYEPVTPGAAPTIVQAAAICQAALGPVVMGLAPTAGNILLAIVMEPTSNNNINGAGWTLVRTTTLSFGYGYKICGAGESVSQQPTNDTVAGSIVIWELSSSTVGPWTGAKSATVTQTLNYNTFSPNQLVLGCCQNTSTVNVPTGNTGMDHSTNLVGSVTSLSYFDKIWAAAGAQSASYTYAASHTLDMAAIVIGK